MRQDVGAKGSAAAPALFAAMDAARAGPRAHASHTLVATELAIRDEPGARAVNV